ncbi:MAG: hypothetical protein ACRC28_04410 [Clostridium sp.]|uniref:hypothetical protein n=1 Tax=Clostridium sp. TaxID=1506 RepID=UPI003F2D8CBE
MNRDIRELREKLMNALLWSENSSTLKELETKAIEEEIFDEDNGDELNRKSNESLGVYIDRCNTALMKNFSRKKYELVKGLYTEYNSFGDSKIEITKAEMPKQRINKKNVAIGVGITAAVVGIAGLFTKIRKK